MSPDQSKAARRAYFRLGEILLVAEEGELADALFCEGADCLADVALALASVESPELALLDSVARANAAGEL